jgi:hypothetical protein
VTWRGPEFLLRGYARVLRRLGLETVLTRGTKALRNGRAPQVLHLGGSYVVAERFEVDAGPAPASNKRMNPTSAA